MVAARAYEPNPFSTAEDLRKQVIRLLQANGEDTRDGVLVLPHVFLEFLDYDVKMALFLNQLIYWTQRTKNPQKWIWKSFHDWYQELGFKESVVRRLLYGDPRAKTRKRTLTDIGVQVKVKRAPDGSPKCHYRLPARRLPRRGTRLSRPKTAPQVHFGNRRLRRIDPVHCRGWNRRIARGRSRALRGNNRSRDSRRDLIR